MSKVITVDSKLQGVYDEKTGEFLEILQDEKYPWRERKEKTLQLANIYDAAGMYEKAERARTCSTWLEYLASSKEGVPRRLNNFNPCHLRLCPGCTARKAKKTAFRLSKIMNLVEKEHQGITFLFLTLTMRNCTGAELSDAITLIFEAFHKLVRNRKVARAVKGWFRALEITRNAKSDTYHPHLHVIIVVEPDYFKRSSGLYIKQSEWVDRWQRSLQVSYRPVVGIQIAKAKGKQSSNPAMAAALEAAKYATKDSEYIDPNMPMQEAVSVVKTYTAALHKRRLLAMGGWFKEAAKVLDLAELEDDSDLVHLDDDDAVRDDLLDLIETYGWHFGAGDYVLRDRRAVADAVLDREELERQYQQNKKPEEEKPPEEDRPNLLSVPVEPWWSR